MTNAESLATYFMALCGFHVLVFALLLGWLIVENGPALFFAKVTHIFFG